MDAVNVGTLWDTVEAFARASARLRSARGRGVEPAVKLATQCRRDAVAAGADEHLLQLARMGRMREVEYLIGRKGGDYCDG